MQCFRTFVLGATKSRRHERPPLAATGHPLGALSVLIDEQHLIQGGQLVEVFEQALRRLGAGQAA